MIRQEEGESLRLYMKRFNREVLEVDEAEDKVQLTTFKAGLKSKEFVVALAKSPLRSMTEMLLKDQKYMNVEDALPAIGVGNTRKKRRNVQEYLKGKKRDRRDYLSSHDNVKLKNNNTRMTVNFTPLVMLVDKILMQIKDDHPLKWLKPLFSSSTRNKKYCHFHRDHGHYMNECRDLKEQIEELIQKGKLQKLVKKNMPRWYKHEQQARSKDKPKEEEKQQDLPKSVIEEIRMINEGPPIKGSFKCLKKPQQRHVNSIHITPLLKHKRRETMDMVFSKEDAKGVKQPQRAS